MDERVVTTVKEYLDALPEERREVVSGMRDLVRRSLPAGYRETFAWGMITYVIPLERYPKTYNGQPLSIVALAAQKNYYSLYLMGVYGNPERENWLRDEARKAGKKLDMGKSCVRFRSLADLPLEAIAHVIASITPEQYISFYESVRRK
jgi:hypothetical protein